MAHNAISAPSSNERPKGDKTGIQQLGFDPSTAKETVTFFSYAMLFGTATILQSRRIFHNHFYKRTTIGCTPGETFRMMAINSGSSEIASRMLRRLKSAVKAMQQGFLKEFNIVVSKDEDNPHNAIEVFTWRFAYDGTNISASFQSGDNMEAFDIRFKQDVSMPVQLKELNVRLRKMCRNVMKALPQGAYATFKLAYTDEAPADYRPEGYQRAPGIYKLDPAARAVAIGTLGNGFYKAAIVVRSVCVDDEVVALGMLNNSYGEANDSMLNITLPSEEPKARGKRRLSAIGKVNDVSMDESFDVPTKKPTRGQARTPGRTSPMNKKSPSQEQH